MTFDTAQSKVATGANNARSAQPEEQAAPFIPQPQTVEETGLDFSVVLDLVVKAIYFGGRPAARQIAAQLALPFPVIDEVLAFMKREQMAEVVGSSGMGEQLYQYSLSQKGAEKAEEALNRNQYVGAAPVPFELYLEVLQRQSIRAMRVPPETVDASVSHLVIDNEVVEALGPAVNSGRSMLLYGGSGNGKSTITNAIGRMLPGEVLIPYAVELNGTIIKVFDPRVHHEIPGDQQADRRSPDPSMAGTERRRDRRWVVSRRPMISVGGELTLKELELRYSPQSQFYIAPIQWKANSGILIVDDFGRQMIQPKELLNRWIVPMEERVDHLSLHTGDMVEVPFDVLLIFSTNLHPSQLGDEAFFRRIRHKIHIPDPSQEQFLEILARVCQQREMPLEPEAALYLVDQYYGRTGRGFKGCHPRDIAELVADICLYNGEQPMFTRKFLDAACHSYFVEQNADEVAEHVKAFGGLSNAA
ncbi:MAG TPA: ATP-binding protein [Dehalococcoidia bacterium]|jgi:predicted ATPase with chaperone activity|nr:ATP-binding protein [Dehalococcoidia bacterium]